MPKAYPKEFRDDVVAVAQRREAGVTIKQIAEDFGISETCLQNWLRKSEIEAAARPGTTAAESAEPRDLRKRNRVLEQENEVLDRKVWATREELRIAIVTWIEKTYHRRRRQDRLRRLTPIQIETTMTTPATQAA